MREGKLEDLKDSDPECYRFLRQFAGLQLDQPDAEPPETGAGLLDLESDLAAIVAEHSQELPAAEDIATSEAGAPPPGADADPPGNDTAEGEEDVLGDLCAQLDADAAAKERKRQRKERRKWRQLHVWSRSWFDFIIGDHCSRTWSGCKPSCCW